MVHLEVSTPSKEKKEETKKERIKEQGAYVLPDSELFSVGGVLHVGVLCHVPV